MPFVFMSISTLHELDVRYGKAMMDTVHNHPSVVQFETFNEGDMVSPFNSSAVVAWAKARDPGLIWIRGLQKNEGDS